MRLLAGDDDSARSLASVAAVVVDPGLAEHLASEAALELRMRSPPGPFGEAFLRRTVVVEGVGRGADADHRTPRVHVVHEVRHLVLGQMPVAGEHHREVGVLEGLESRDVVGDGRIDLAGLAVHREQHRAAEAVALGEDPRQGRHRFLGAVLLVAGDEDDVLPLPRPAARAERHPGFVLGADGQPSGGKEGQREEPAAKRMKTVTRHS